MLLKSKPLLLSSFFSSVLLVLVIVIVIPLIIWASIAAFSEGQKGLPSMKIISPTNGQNVSIGSNLTISGISTGTNTTAIGNNNSNNRCHVSVIVNNIKPYQDATADGPNGANDYSRWHFALSPNYSPIKEGENKLTGKLSCLPAGSNVNSTNSTITNNLVKWYSVNVTGVSTPTSSQLSKNNQTITNSTIDRSQQPQSKTGGNTSITSNSTAITPTPQSNSTSNSTSQNLKKENNSNKVATSGGSLSAKLTQSPSTSKSTSSYNYNNNNNAKPVSISIQSSQNIVNGRGTSTITAIAYDAISGTKIDNAILKMKITFTSNGTTKEVLSHNGEVTYSSEIKPNAKNDISSYKATVQASAPGYNSAFKATTSAAASATTSAAASATTSAAASATINNNH